MRKLFWRWVNRRIPRADEYRLGRRNIFVLPTREGLMFAGLLILCLLTGINYQNSLIYLFTFFWGPPSTAPSSRPTVTWMIFTSPSSRWDRAWPER